MDKAFAPVDNDSADGGSNGHVVAAHRLLGSSAVVSMGIATLLELWDRLERSEGKQLLQCMAGHAAAVDAGLKHLTNGLDPDAVADTSDETAPSKPAGARLGEHLMVSDLVHLALDLGMDGSDGDEGAVELLALSGRNRKCVEMAVTRCRFLPPGEDVDRAVDYLNEALRLGDSRGHWLSGLPNPYLTGRS